ncbi:MAG: anthranilate phosphoribosyltransferase [Candidatus Marinimicrobia bacterium]|nr:anthranilate phosphoribosyltransferase [Candidatus Neomarinimicrobiota bacterium]
MEVEQLLIRFVEDPSPIDEEEAYLLANKMMNGEMTEAQIGAILTAIKLKGETPEILYGFAKSLKDKVSEFHLDCYDLIDTCGTGGDKKGTFNISTVASIVLAGGGVRVAKHGNRSITSKCGSADLLAELGVDISIPPMKAVQAITEIGIGFLFAPVFHTAMKNVMNPRRELKFKTLFNVIGPLANPVNVKRQLMGVFSEDLIQKVIEVFKKMGHKHCLVVYGKDGVDEISISNSTIIYELRDNEVKSYEITPEDFGISRHPIESIKGGDAKENAEITLRLLKGEMGPYRDAIVLNAAAGFYVAGKAGSIEDGITMAEESIDSGRAMEKLNELIRFTRGEA